MEAITKRRTPVEPSEFCDLEVGDEFFNGVGEDNSPRYKKIGPGKYEILDGDDKGLRGEYLRDWSVLKVKQA